MRQTLAPQPAQATPTAPLRLAEPERDENVAARVLHARAELERLGRDYDEAVRRAVRARERAEIGAAFDRSDALQGRILRAGRRFRALERELAASAMAEIHALPAHADRDELDATADDAG